MTICSSVLCSCKTIAENMDSCDRVSNVNLNFKYTGDTTDDMSWFNKVMDKVSLFVYDEYGFLVEKASRSFEGEEINTTVKDGIKLDLCPGNYRVVCWSNMYENSSLTGISNYNTARFHHPKYGQNNIVLNTQDQTYYGSLLLQVPEDRNVSDTVIFKGANILIDVVVKEFVSGTRSDALPIVKIMNAMPEYGMDMSNAQAFDEDYIPLESVDNGGDYIRATARVFRFNDDNPIQIRIEGSDRVVTFVNVALSKLMNENFITVEGVNEATIHINLDFTDYYNDLNVKIGIEGWKSNVVTPDL